MTPGKLPYGPLERLLRARHDSIDWTPDTSSDGGRHGRWDGLRWVDEPTDTTLWCDEVAARILHVDRRTILRWKNNGLAPAAADAAAVAAGYATPLEVWGKAWICADIYTYVHRQARRQPTDRQIAVHLIDHAMAQLRRQQTAVRLELARQARNLLTLSTGCDSEHREAA